MIKPHQTGDWLESEALQWDNHANEYDASRQKDLVYMAGVDAAVAALAPCSDELVLDAGCGTGLSICQMLNTQARFVAMDLSINSLRYMRCKSIVACEQVTPIRGDLTSLPFQNEVFDKVLCANTLQHVPTPFLRDRCMAELRRVAKPGTRVVVSAHNYSKPKRRANWPKEGSAGSHSGKVGYIYRFESDEFAELLSRHFTLDRVFGAGMPLWYRYKLSPLMQIAERKLQRFSISTHWGNMLVAVGRAA
jgi:ubiquinone/menaquinone biosynthesis C-methylase UbiE